MKRAIIILSILLVMIISVCTAFVINSFEKKETQIAEMSDETVTDECVEEYNNLAEDEISQTNAQTEKTSPNCTVLMKRHYNECGHTIEEYSNLNKELVNKTRDEIQEVYNAWTIEKFSNNEIILSRSFESQCGEHYIVRNKEGKVAIFVISGDGTETEIEETQIATEFLTDTDKIELDNGIRANGKQELNQVIENFE